MEPQYLDQYGSWYQIIEGDLHCCPANTDGSQDIEGWGPVDEDGSGTWEEAIEFFYTINGLFGTQFKLPTFGWSYTEAGTVMDWMHETPDMIAPKILHIWDIDLREKPISHNLVISTVHSFLEVNESFAPEEMQEVNLLEVGKYLLMGVHAGWVRIERVQ